MRVKNKIRLGLGFIFVVVLFFGAISIYFVDDLSNGSKIQFKNNYRTLGYMRDMRVVLDENKLPLNSTAIAAFNKQLTDQEHNITEKGELEATRQVRSAFGILQSATATPSQQEAALSDAHRYIRTIEGLNMKAIEQKTETAQSAVDEATLILGIFCCFTFLVLFSFSVNVSRLIAEPLFSLTEAFEAIGEKNYDYRLYFGKDREFAELANGFNDMAARIKKDEGAGLTQLFAERRRLEAIIERLRDAVVVTNEKQEIVFINTPARNLFGLPELKLTGLKTSYSLPDNHLLRSVLDKSDEKPLKLEIDGKDTLFALQSAEIFVPNIAPIELSELNIARLSAGKVYVLRSVGEMHEA